jgi:hypothetical protein
MQCSRNWKSGNYQLLKMISFRTSKGSYCYKLQQHQPKKGDYLVCSFLFFYSKTVLIQLKRFCNWSKTDSTGNQKQKESLSFCIKQRKRKQTYNLHQKWRTTSLVFESESRNVINLGIAYLVANKKKAINWKQLVCISAQLLLACFKSSLCKSFAGFEFVEIYSSF